MRFVQLIDPRNLHRLLLIFLCKVVNSSNMVYSTSLSSSQLPMAGGTFLDGTFFFVWYLHGDEVFDATINDFSYG